MKGLCGNNYIFTVICLQTQTHLVLLLRATTPMKTFVCGVWIVAMLIFFLLKRVSYHHKEVC